MRGTDKANDELTDRIIEAAIEVHRELGPGLLESTCEACLEYEMRERGLKVARQVPIPANYKKVRLKTGYRLDLLVEDEVIVEVKALDELNADPSGTAPLLPEPRRPASWVTDELQGTIA